MKTKILELSEYYLEVIGILVPNENRSMKIKAFIKNVVAVVILIPVFSVMAGNYIIKHFDEYQNCLVTFAAICAAILTTGKLLSLKTNESHIKELIELFRETVDDGMF